MAEPAGAVPLVVQHRGYRALSYRHAGDAQAHTAILPRGFVRGRENKHFARLAALERQLHSPRPAARGQCQVDAGRQVGLEAVTHVPGVARCRRLVTSRERGQREHRGRDFGRARELRRAPVEQRHAVAHVEEHPGAQDATEPVLVGTDAGKMSVIERSREPRGRLLALRRPGDHLGEQGVIHRRYGITALEAAIDPQRLAAAASQRAAACRRSAGSRVPDPPRRHAPRWHGRRGGSALAASGNGSPAATRSCHSTRSSPVTASVTVCSTCSRVFISRKKNSRPSKRNSTVPALGSRCCAPPAPPRHAAIRAAAAAGRGPAPPRSASDAVAAPSSHGRRDARNCHARPRTPAPRCAAAASDSAR